MAQLPLLPTFTSIEDQNVKSAMQILIDYLNEKDSGLQGWSHVPSLTLTSWSSYIPSFSAGWGTVTNKSIFWRRIGDVLEVQGAFETGTVAGSNGKIGLPNSVTIDSTKIPPTSTYIAGTMISMDVTGSNTTIIGGGWLGFLFADGSNNDGVFFTYQTNTGKFVSNNVNAIFPSSAYVSFNFKVPILGWGF